MRRSLISFNSKIVDKHLTLLLLLSILFIGAQSQLLPATGLYIGISYIYFR